MIFNFDLSNLLSGEGFTSHKQLAEFVNQSLSDNFALCRECIERSNQCEVQFVNDSPSKIYTEMIPLLEDCLSVLLAIESHVAKIKNKLLAAAVKDLIQWLQSGISYEKQLLNTIPKQKNKIFANPPPKSNNNNVINTNSNNDRVSFQGFGLNFNKSIVKPESIIKPAPLKRANAFVNYIDNSNQPVYHQTQPMEVDEDDDEDDEEYIGDEDSDDDDDDDDDDDEYDSNIPDEDDEDDKEDEEDEEDEEGEQVLSKAEYAEYLRLKAKKGIPVKKLINKASNKAPIKFIKPFIAETKNKVMKSENEITQKIEPNTVKIEPQGVKIPVIEENTKSA